MAKSKKYIVKCYTTLVVEATSPEEAIKKYKKMPGLAIIASPMLRADHLD